MATAETSVEVLVGAMPTGNGMRKRNATPQDGEADEEQILLDPQRTSAQDGAPRTLPQRVREWWNTDPIDHRSKMVIYESTMRLMVVIIHITLAWALVAELLGGTIVYATYGSDEWAGFEVEKHIIFAMCIFLIVCISLLFLVRKHWPTNVLVCVGTVLYLGLLIGFFIAVQLRKLLHHT